MKIAVIGLGLIGGSLAKACKQNAGNVVLGYDISESVALKAKLVGAIDKVITPADIGEADVVFVALYKAQTIEFVKANATKFKKGAIVMDCAGTKRGICEELSAVASAHGFYFVGSHPMAGREQSGFEYSRDNLFDNASMLLTPTAGTPIEVLAKIKAICKDIGFAEVVITTPEHHDEVIAFTSQLAHVVSNAYVKSPTAKIQRGYSAGSYRDMTRVAYMNVPMWRELFFDNKDNLCNEIDTLIKNLTELKGAIKAGDAKGLTKLLEEGVNAKKEADKI